jgi:YD repeat-containing protein
LNQIRTQKVQSLQAGLNQLAATEQIRLDAKIIEFIAETATSAVTEYLEAAQIAEQAREDAKITEFITETATSAVTEYLEVLAKEEARVGADPRNLKQTTDQRGLITELKYDTKGNITEKALIGDITGDGVIYVATTKYAYNDNNLLTSVIDPLGNEIAVFYEDSDHPQLPTRIERRVPGWFSSNTIFSVQNTYHKTGNDETGAKGLLQRQTIVAGTPDEATIEYTYNEQGLLISQKQITGTSDPDVITQLEYNPDGELIRQTDQFGTHDPREQILSRTDRDPVDNEKFTYEPGGQIATYINPEGGKTKYYYTPDGKLRRQENPDGTLQEWRYRLNGRLDKEIFSDGTYWQMSYDDEERIITRTRKNSSEPDAWLMHGGNLWTCLK